MWHAKHKKIHLTHCVSYWHLHVCCASPQKVHTYECQRSISVAPSGKISFWDLLVIFIVLFDTFISNNNFKKMLKTFYIDSCHLICWKRGLGFNTDLIHTVTGAQFSPCPVLWTMCMILACCYVALCALIIMLASVEFQCTGPGTNKDCIGNTMRKFF